MKHRRTPREKKKLEYTKDHFTPASHGFRKSLPRERAHANQAYRRQVHQRIAALEIHEEVDVPERLRPEQVRRQQVRKWCRVAPMGERIQERQEEHALSSIQGFFWYDYDCDRDRTRFSAMLGSQVGGRTKSSRLLASYFKHLMDPSTEGRWAADEWLSDRGQKWLRAFLQDEPAWEERLRTWIASFEQG